jgi:hypothetical protein
MCWITRGQFTAQTGNFLFATEFISNLRFIQLSSGVPSPKMNQPEQRTVLYHVQSSKTYGTLLPSLSLAFMKWRIRFIFYVYMSRTDVRKFVLSFRRIMWLITIPISNYTCS